MEIFSDFSDTIAKPKNSNKFPPFELELGNILKDELDPTERDEFNKKYTKGYEEFIKIRRDDTITYPERVNKWLSPYTDLLKVVHIKQLVKTFRLNESFIIFTKFLKKELKSERLNITIVSGTLTQIIQEFLARNDIKEKLGYIDFKILATELIMDKSGFFTGKILPVNELVYKGNFPQGCLIIGDNAMENYGLGENLVNVQNYQSEEAKTVFKKVFKKDE